VKKGKGYPYWVSKLVPGSGTEKTEGGGGGNKGFGRRLEKKKAMWPVEGGTTVGGTITERFLTEVSRAAVTGIKELVSGGKTLKW